MNLINQGNNFISDVILPMAIELKTVSIKTVT